MDGDGADGSTDDDPAERRVRRRRVLSLSGVGLLVPLAGCQGGEDGTGDGDTSTTPTAAGTTQGTDAEATEESTTAEEATTATEDPSTTTERETVTPVTSSAYHDPGDGFAEVAPWLDDDTPVYTVSEPTREAFLEAVDQSGPRVVVFETSGTVDLGGESAAITHDECWLAGQTAPSPGITLVAGGLVVDASDCVVQHVRVRPGDNGGDVDTPESLDAIATTEGTRNNVVDHCTATWSIDEGLSVYGRHVTVSNCLIAEALDDSLHPKGPHGYGALGTPYGAGPMSHLGNVYALNRARNPRLGSGEGVVVNCLSYCFERGVELHGGTHAVVGNALRRSLDPPPVASYGDDVAAYLAFNVSDAAPTVGREVERLTERPLWPEGLVPMAGDEVEDHALAHAGARPADRTRHDERVLAHVRNRTGDFVDSQSEVGGYPDLAENTRTLAVPDTGLRRWLREQALAVEP